MSNKDKGKQTSIKQANTEKERQYLSVITRIYVLFVFAIYPLIVGFEGYDNIIYSKALTYWWVTLIFLFAFLLFYTAYRLGLGKNTDGIRWYKKLSFLDWAFIAFFIVITISSILSPYRDTLLGRLNRNDGWLSMFCMMVFYFPVSRWYKPKQLDFSIFAVSSIILCLIGFLQYYGYDFLNLFPYNRPPYASPEGVSYYTGFSIAFRTTIGNINFLSMYFCLTILSFFVLYIKAKGASRFLYLCACIMNFVMMQISGSDGGKVGVLGAMVLLISYFVCEKKSAGRTFVLIGCLGLSYVLHHWNMVYNIMPLWNDDSPLRDLNIRRAYFTLPLGPVLLISLVSIVIGVLIIRLKHWPTNKTASLAGLAVTLVIIGGGLLGIETAGKNLPPHSIIYEAREVMHGRMEDNFGSSRGYVWRKALEAMPEQPLFGTGQDTFFYALGEEFQSESYELYRVVFDKAHNDFLQIMLCNGVFGLLSYIAIIAGIILYSLKPAFHDHYLLMAFAAVMAYLGQSFFGIDSIVVTPLFWLMIAIVRNRQLAAAAAKRTG